jgi:lipoprotein-anchoring transpeptidase ErfK/SrfK
MSRGGAGARLLGSRRGVRAAALALLVGGSSTGIAAPARAADRHVAASQQLVVLLDARAVRSRPTTSAGRIESVASHRPLTGARTVLPVIATTIGTEGAAWLRVRLPGRPNGHTGWIRDRRVRHTSTEWRLTVDISARRVRVYRDGLLERRYRAVVGKPSTPTPTGRFFVEEAVALAPQDAGAPFALATSARSQVLQEFDGGPGQIALHGMGNLYGTLGTAVSHGCVRLSSNAITWLARRIGAGAPLTIGR